MSTSTVSRFFAFLTLACWAGLIALAVTAIASRAGSARARSALAELGSAATWVAWIVALVATAGSLYYSEVAHFEPCLLCWYQRLAVYPLSVILLVGALRRDRAVGWYVLPITAIGIGFSVYHTQLQAFPEQGASSFCTTTAPCTVRYVWELGFVSLPFMALTALLTISALMVVQLVTSRRAGREPARPPATHSTLEEQQVR